MRVLISILITVVLMPNLAFAAGNNLNNTTSNIVTQTAGSYERQINLGGGYSVPPSNRGNAASASVGVDANFGLDCSGIDWTTQLKEQMKIDVSMSDVKVLGTAAVASGVSYLSAAIRPTWYESLQNTIKNAKAKIGIMKTDCRTMEAALMTNDPLNILDKKQQATETMAQASNGTPLDKAQEEAAKKGMHWSLHEEIDGSKLDQKSKNVMKAFLGNLVLDAGGGKKSANADVMNNDDLEADFQKAKGKITAEAEKRLLSGIDCDKPYFTKPKEDPKKKGKQKPLNNVSEYGSKDQALVEEANANGVKLKGKRNKKSGKLNLTKNEVQSILQIITAASITDQLIGRTFPETSCGAYRHMNKVGMRGTDRRFIAQMVADTITIRGMAGAIEDLNAKMQALKEISDSPEGLTLAEGRIKMLESRYQKLKDKIELSSMLAKTRMLAEKQAKLDKALAKSEQNRNARMGKEGIKSMHLAN